MRTKCEPENSKEASAIPNSPQAGVAGRINSAPDPQSHHVVGGVFGAASRRDGSRYGVGRNTAPRSRAFTRNLRVSWIKVW
jgi:hypothetical protein